MPLEVTTFSVGELSTYHRNPRRGAVGMIAESLKARGQYRAIVVNLGRLTGRPLEVLAGNHTLLAATLVELDPRYADMICRRFQEHTGTIPVRDGEQVDFTAGADGDG